MNNITGNFINSIQFTPTSCNEISHIVNNLKNSSNGLNIILTKIFKFASVSLVPAVKYLVNESFETGIFPEILKVADVLPIVKYYTTNFRPISLLPWLSKVIERCVANRLCNFFDKFKIISDKQFGFRRGMSTSDAIIHFTEYVYEQLNKNHVVGVFFDLKKLLTLFVMIHCYESYAAMVLGVYC